MNDIPPPVLEAVGPLLRFIGTRDVKYSDLPAELRDVLLLGTALHFQLIESDSRKHDGPLIAVAADSAEAYERLAGYEASRNPTYWLSAVGKAVSLIAAKAKSAPSKPPINRGKMVNARMLETMMNNPECRGWTCTKWAEYLKCSRPAVVATPVWQELEQARQLLKIEKRKDRQRSAKGSDQRRRRAQD